MMVPSPGGIPSVAVLLIGITQRPLVNLNQRDKREKRWCFTLKGKALVRYPAVETVLSSIFKSLMLREGGRRACRCSSEGRSDEREDLTRSVLFQAPVRDESNGLDVFMLERALRASNFSVEGENIKTWRNAKLKRQVCLSERQSSFRISMSMLEAPS